MSQENVEAFWRAVSAFHRRDWDAYLELMDPDVEAVPLLVKMEGDYSGHAGVRRWLGDVFDVFPDFAIEVVEVSFRRRMEAYSRGDYGAAVVGFDPRDRMEWASLCSFLDHTPERVTEDALFHRSPKR